MSTVIVEKNIVIPPNKLCKNINRVLYDKIRDVMLDKCDQDYGYVEKISEDITIVSNTVSAVGNSVNFLCRFGIKCFKPIVGQKYSAKVCMIISNGIFAELSGKIKVLVPYNKMEEYKYDSEKGVFRKGKKSIKTQDVIEVELTLIKYENKNFSCIGVLR